MRSERALSSGEKVQCSSSLAVLTARSRRRASSRREAHCLERLAMSSPLGALRVRAVGRLTMSFPGETPLLVRAAGIGRGAAIWAAERLLALLPRHATQPLRPR